MTYIDYNYIFGRDNHSCVFCDAEIPENYLTWRPQDFVHIINPAEENYPSNCVTKCLCRNTERTSRFPSLRGFPGRLIVVTGAMFSSKSTFTKSLIYNYNYALDGSYIWVKPNIDSRGVGITTHNKDETREMREPLIADHQRPDLILEKLKDYKIVAIDEVEFFSNRIIFLVHSLLRAGKLVIVNGLKLDFRRNHFGMMPHLLAEADDIFCRSAVCSICRRIESGTRTKKKDETGPTISPGGSENYFSSCPECEQNER